MEPNEANLPASPERFLQRLSGPTFVVGLAVFVVAAALSFLDPLPQGDIQIVGNEVTWVLPAGPSWDRGIRVGDDPGLDTNGDPGEQQEEGSAGLPPSEVHLY